jgi:hypothetical protein
MPEALLDNCRCIMLKLALKIMEPFSTINVVVHDYSIFSNKVIDTIVLISSLQPIASSKNISYLVN